MSIINELRWMRLWHRSYIRVCNGGYAKIGGNVKIKNSKIIVTPGSSIEIGDDVTIVNATISVNRGKCSIAHNSVIGNPNTSPLIDIDNGEVHIGNHSIINARRFWVRFGGIVKIGNYSNINNGSEVRCDESVSIGSYNQISYNVNIWDTNTHNILSTEERRTLAEKFYPKLGIEMRKPSTSSVAIGDDCWLGESSAILKGTQLGNGVIVGTNCMLVGKKIPDNTTVVTDIKLKLIER